LRQDYSETDIALVRRTRFVHE